MRHPGSKGMVRFGDGAVGFSCGGATVETQTGEQLRIKGMDQAASKFDVDLTRAQLIAEMLGMGGMLVNVDDVRKAFLEHYHRPLKIGNAAGSIFAGWECVGFVRSTRPEARSRMIRTWKAKQAYHAAPEPFEVGIENGIRFCIACSKNTEECTCEVKG
jgi:hypothetical protein